MNETEKTAMVQRLGKAMSQISEDCYHAGWLGNSEYYIPELCRQAVLAGKSIYWGHGEVTPQKGRELCALADQIGSWATLDESGVSFEPFQPFPIPDEFIKDIEREQKSATSRRAQLCSRADGR